MRVLPCCILTIICALLASCGVKHQPVTAPGSPNILFIVADDLGGKDLGTYGNQQLKTPNIDALATGGAQFNNAFVAAPSCAPSRATLITGQYPHTHNVTALTHRYPSKALKPFYTTLAGELKNAGYNTGIDGKWHVAPFYPTYFYGYKKRMTGIGIFKDDWKIPDAGDALSFIRESVADSQPFYLELNFIQNHRVNHGRFYYSEAFPVLATATTVPQHYALPDWPEIREDIARFYSQTMEMDAIIGDIVAALTELDIREQTLIIFISDNGQPYPGAKMTMYDRGTSVPLIANWQGTINPGLQIDSLINSIDIMPSILHAVEVAVPDAVQGRSFMPLILQKLPGSSAVYSERAVIFSELDYHVNYLPSRSVRTREWKYIKNYSDLPVGLDELDTTDWAIKLAHLPDQPWNRPRVPEELYHLASDPSEKNNLATDQQYSKELAHLRQLLIEHQRKTGDPFLGREFTYDWRADHPE